MYEAYQCGYTGEPCDMKDWKDCEECEARKEFEIEMELATAQWMEDHFDMNGDPYRDFEGYPW